MRGWDAGGRRSDAGLNAFGGCLGVYASHVARVPGAGYTRRERATNGPPEAVRGPASRMPCIAYTPVTRTLRVRVGCGIASLERAAVFAVHSLPDATAGGVGTWEERGPARDDALADVGSAQQAHALVALSLSYLSPPARSFVLFIHGGVGVCWCVCVWAGGTMCPAQSGRRRPRPTRTRASP